MPTPRVEIEYCTQCQWMLRAGWLAQELLSTFGTDIGEVALIPSTGGVFKVRVNHNQVWCRQERSGFPQAKELKALIRDVIAPTRDLGHIDKTS